MIDVCPNTDCTFGVLKVICQFLEEPCSEGAIFFFLVFLSSFLIVCVLLITTNYVGFGRGKGDFFERKGLVFFVFNVVFGGLVVCFGGLLWWWYKRGKGWFDGFYFGFLHVDEESVFLVEPVGKLEYEIIVVDFVLLDVFNDLFF